MPRSKQSKEDNLKLDSVPHSVEELLASSQKISKSLEETVSALHAHALSVRPRPDDLASNFISPQAEVLWQFIRHHNKQVWKTCGKDREEFSHKNALCDYSNLLMGKKQPEEEHSSDGEDDEESEHASFTEENATFDEDIEDIEDEGESGGEEENEITTRKFRRSVVDDKFFSLAEMHSFLDAEDKRTDAPEIIGADEYSWFGSTNYKYEDFFGKEEPVKKADKRKAADSQNESKSTKRVRFAMDEEENEKIDETDGEDEDMEVEGEEEKEIGDRLMETDEGDTQRETRLNKSQQKLQETIRKLEEENLSTRSWELSGEVTGNQREENALLETQLEFDVTAKPAPIITPEYTEKLEAMIIQRIKDKTFDDVVRKVKRVSESAEQYKSKAFEEDVLQKKSLSEVYEKEYQQTAQKDQTKKDEKNPKHEEIERRMKEFFRKLDALSNFSLNPPEVTSEVKVITNLPTLKMEEVGITASTDEQLLAPEEVKRREKGEIKSKEERDKTDKNRERRRKKIRQRTMVAKVGEERALAGQLAQKRAKGKKGKTEDGPAAKGGNKLKSGSFFAKLQQKVKDEISEKTTRNFEKKKQKVSHSGAKYKL